jgi:hypothetical protein
MNLKKLEINENRRGDIYSHHRSRKSEEVRSQEIRSQRSVRKRRIRSQPRFGVLMRSELAVSFAFSSQADIPE